MTNDAGRDWKFEPAVLDQSPSNRVSWHFTSEPYAGGGVRQFIPIPSLQRLYGARRMLSVQAQFYLAGRLRAEASEKAAIIGEPMTRIFWFLSQRS